MGLIYVLACLGGGEGGVGKRGLVGKLMLVRWGGLARMNAAFGQVVSNPWRKRLKTAHITGARPLPVGSCDGLRRRQMRGEP